MGLCYKQLIESLYGMLEERKRNVKYLDDEDRIIAALPKRVRKADSQLLEELAILSEKKRKIEQQIKELSVTAKVTFEDLFDSLDALKTRLVRTEKAILTISRPGISKKIDYEKAVELIKDMVPELVEVIDETINSVTKEVESQPTYKYKLISKNESLQSLLHKIWNKLKSWFKKYDNKLDKVENIIGI